MTPAFQTTARSLVAAILACSLAVSSTAGADGPFQTTITPQDTFLNLDGANYSAHSMLMTYTWPDYRAANAILMKFDLSSVPADAVIEEATLHLALVESDAMPESTYTVTVHRVTGKNPDIAAASGYMADGATGWTPNACCYSGVPLAQADISAAYDARAIDKTPGYKSWTVTAMVREWLAGPGANFGAVLNSDASKPRDRYRYFASAVYPDPGLRPFLRVIYSSGGSGGGPSDITAPTVSITSPAGGATVNGTTSVRASASDDVGVAGVQFFLDGSPLGPEVTLAPYSRWWDTTATSDGWHTLTARARDAAGNAATSAPVTMTVSNGSGSAFAPGDVVVSLETGPVQWRRPDGRLEKVLTAAIAGTGEGVEFDPSGRLYVARWCIDDRCSNGNTVEMFDAFGQSLGAFGSGYDCAPHAIAFDPTGTAYVGQGGCTGAVLKFAPGQAPAIFPVASENAGSFFLDLAADGCTIFYTSWSRNVKRFDACGGGQLPDFNVAPLPAGDALDLRILPDGGVLVSNGDAIARLAPNGALVRTYRVPGEYGFWTGLDLAGDGTFWAGNYGSSNVYRFDLAGGAVLAVFNTGTPPSTVVGIAVKN
jgi:hypothetical protein